MHIPGTGRNTGGINPGSLAESTDWYTMSRPVLLEVTGNSADTATPEPGSAALAAVGMLALAAGIKRLK